jgi:hypothetical protein
LINFSSLSKVGQTLFDFPCIAYDLFSFSFPLLNAFDCSAPCLFFELIYSVELSLACYYSSPPDSSSYSSPYSYSSSSCYPSLISNFFSTGSSFIGWFYFYGAGGA